MCPPDFYGIEYEINPWMSRARGSSPEQAQQQWHNLHDTLVELGVQVELMTPQPGLPDLVFTANAGLMFGKRFFSSRFRHEVRARETPHFDAWFAEHGFTVEHLPEGMYFEGAGDALFCGPTLFAGYRIRSHVSGHQYLGKCSQRLVLPLELVDRASTISTPASARWPPARRSISRMRSTPMAARCLKQHIPRLLAVATTEAARFACNAVVVGKTRDHETRLRAARGGLAAAGATSRWPWSWTNSSRRAAAPNA